jgi:hypothetical protein
MFDRCAVGKYILLFLISKGKGFPNEFAKVFPDGTKAIMTDEACLQ